MMSADNRFSANSNERRVRVEFSKNRLAMVMSRSEGTFLMVRLMTSLKFSAVEKIRSISARESSLIPIKCGVLSNDITIYLYFSKINLY